MARRPRQCPAGFPVHVVQRGNNRQVCFASDADLKAYSNWLHEAADQFAIDIHAWVFMANHVHLLMTPHSADSISRCMQYLGRYYVRFFNKRYRRTGTLFEGRFRSSIVQNEHYLLACQRYIELNPVRAGMVTDPADYSWSSYRAHGFATRPAMWKPHDEYLALGLTRKSRQFAYRELVAQQLPCDVVTDIRQALNTGLVLGNDCFREQVQKLTGVRQQHLKRGPQPRKYANQRA